jgi:dihydropteroate synthase
VVEKASAMLSEGAAILDIGGYSTRPGADDIPIDEELQRVIPAIQEILKTHPEAVISVDTFRSGVAQEAIKVGAAIVNDISGGQLDEAMYQTVADLQVPYILMHSRGNPKTMQQMTQYDNLVFELLNFLAEKVKELRQMGVADIILDPGFGFAKTRQQNFSLLKNLSEFRLIGCPVLAGLSRKSMIWKTLDITPAESLNGTTALNMLALHNGASILRVHDVRPTVEAIKLYTEYTAQDDLHEA